MGEIYLAEPSFVNKVCLKERRANARLPGSPANVPRIEKLYLLRNSSIAAASDFNEKMV